MRLTAKMKMMERQWDMRRALRKLVRDGRTRSEAAVMVGVSYDCAVMWTRGLPYANAVHKSIEQGMEDYVPKPASEPTGTKIGSRERIEVYRLRMERGEVLHHPGDSREVIEPLGGRHAAV